MPWLVGRARAWRRKIRYGTGSRARTLAAMLAEVPVNTIKEIKQLEERLRAAELGPDPGFFEEFLADDAIIDGQRAKRKIVAAHQPAEQPKFTRVEMSDLEILDYGNAAVVTCIGTYEGPQWSGTLKFMRVWFKREGRWQIIAGSISS